VQQTLEAFNAMTRRVTHLLNEKDVMLGALGHDLRTPLASLRIRVESMEPASERQKAIRTIEEAANLLDDILELARRGRSAEPEQTIDLAVLVEDIAEDYAEAGAAVEIAQRMRTPARCRPVLFRRLLRNLIDNSLTYAGAATLSVRADGENAIVSVEDRGPGISPDALISAKQPFMRGEDSRSRSTGGAGLGLAIADAIARTHGGTLLLENRDGGGLSASAVIPLAEPGKSPGSGKAG
jgi:signal transduction histidine kinase